MQIPTALPIQIAPQKQPLTGRIVAGLVGGLILAIIVMNIFVALISDMNAKEQSMAVKTVSVLVFFLCWAGAVVVAVKANRAAKGWRWLLISNACLSFALPLAGFFMGGKSAYQLSPQGRQIEAAVFSPSSWACWASS